MYILLYFIIVLVVFFGLHILDNWGGEGESPVIISLLWPVSIPLGLLFVLFFWLADYAERFGQFVRDRFNKG